MYTFDIDAERPAVQFMLGDSDLLMAGGKGKFTSLQLAPSYKPKITFKTSSRLETWKLSTTCPPTAQNVRRYSHPVTAPQGRTKEALEKVGHINMCENGTQYLLQEDDFFILVGYTRCFPITVQSRDTSSLLLSWTVTSPLHTVALYDITGKWLRNETTDQTLYRVAGLEPCREYRVCVHLARLLAVMCVSDLTDPMKPSNFSILRSNAMSITVSWTYPQLTYFSWFRLTVFLLNHTLGAYVQLDSPYEHAEFDSEFVVENIPPCSKVRLALQTVCETQVHTTSSMPVVVDGSTGPGTVYDVQFMPEELKIVWNSHSGPDVAFGYQLLKRGDVLQRGSVNTTSLDIGYMEPDSDSLFELELFETCFKMSGHSVFYQFDYKAFSQNLCKLCELSELAIVVPWKLPSHLMDTFAKPRLKFKEIFKHKLEVMFKGYEGAAEVVVELLDFSQLENATKIHFEVFVADGNGSKVLLSGARQRKHIESLNLTNITAKDNHTLQWDDADECASSDLNKCFKHSHCINTLDSYTCVCSPGYFDFSEVGSTEGALCDEAGMYVLCEPGLMKVGISKEFLKSRLAEDLSLVLNDGSCPAEEGVDFYYYAIRDQHTYCGALIQGNDTHAVFKHTVYTTHQSRQVVTRTDLTLAWECVYPREYLLQTQPGLDPSSVPVSVVLIKYNSSGILQLRMTLHRDDTFSDDLLLEEVLYWPSSDLFFEVTLSAPQGTFADGFVLEVVSCWATQTPNSAEEPKTFFLKGSCPVDHTFKWYSVQEAEQRSRFSVQMFSIAPYNPIHVHCWIKICTVTEKHNCSRKCLATPVRRRDLNHNLKPGEAVLSLGPIAVWDHPDNIKEDPELSFWGKVQNAMLVVGGTAGFLLLALFGVIVLKVIVRCSDLLQERTAALQNHHESPVFI
ncbi:uromodulin-like 1 [Acipenser oxyrinchus oxyrinchus]|uniref:Uromodulin-like 1 n=1 Tax=Acipenser oxyrinchus oxyrinchus TaxID=40147 RepID=A0AAD8DIN8_ACIOX|nr:uromodulin-like 1 [Acipenser oxyrinchus oxyrinchus]